MWRRGAWGTLLNLIDHLPRASFTRQAMSEDPEHVQAVIEAMDKRGTVPSNAPSIAEYDGVAERLDELIDRVGSLISVTVAANQPPGKKPPRFEPRPRPETDFERQRHLNRLAKHKKLADRVLARRKREKQSKQVDSPTAT